MKMSEPRRPTFYYDIGEPWCWLVGERVTEALGEVPIWQPVLGGELSSRAVLDRREFEDQAAAHTLQGVRWPDRFPFDSGLVMRAATFAKQTGRGVAFSLAAMRQAFAAGRDLSVEDNVLIAAAACELHPRAVLAAVGTRGVTVALAEATASARALGVEGLPAVEAGGRLLAGARLLDELVREPNGA
ncbi:MAG: hypothetical protein NVSMB25_03790 [Thermoleophilaceae bacterium]